MILIQLARYTNLNLSIVLHYLDKDNEISHK